jgi:hypothetical protein
MALLHQWFFQLERDLGVISCRVLPTTPICASAHPSAPTHSASSKNCSAQARWTTSGSSWLWSAVSIIYRSNTKLISSPPDWDSHRR